MKNILSIDVEELFHTEYARDSKIKSTCFRTPNNINGILQLLDEFDLKATFFVVGEVAERFPGVIKEIDNGGHEVAFHSYDHRSLSKKNSSKLRSEIEDFNKLLMSVTGNRCIGFRAPSFSLNNKTIWALEVLEKSGMLYDSSVFPIRTPLYGVFDAPVKPYKPSNRDLTVENLNGKLWEFPLTVYSFLGFRIPAAGGFYLRSFPSIVRQAVRKMNSLGLPAVIYIHNWELDPDTPKLKLNPYRYFVTYYNTHKMVNLFKCILSEFEFTSFSGYMEENKMV
ncbi:MAG: polysaccharide deacetylase family protein [Candidatus Methanomethyliaceae archaeon]